ncbi:GntR family transcriptional regulator [Roseomonas gilardii]|uniref:GntR family transcriptional regulator n=1 Tax=Roseomonas gilardii TaxID=257708 RepID=UPI0012DDA422|nr:FCD domain-containing protein [Roseomonas gilardii]
MSEMQREATTASLTQSAYERLRADLLSCRLAPGEKLRIADLCERLSVSLSAVREALSRLTAEGLVVAEPQRGFRAAPISADELRDLTAVRLEIEGMCLRRSIAAGDLAWEERLVAAHHRMARLPYRDPDDPQRASEVWAEAHAAFHRALVAGCDSPWLLRLREILYAQTERYRRLSIPLSSAPRDLAREHREIAEAALARDADRAGALLAEHLEKTTWILLGAAETRIPASALSESR